MANGNKVVGQEMEHGVEVILYENEQRGTQFKAYQFANIEFERGDDLPQRNNKTGQYLRNEDGSLQCGVCRTVSAVTAMGGNLTHAVFALAGVSFQRSVNFLKSALLPRTGKSMVTFDHDGKTLVITCNIRLTILDKTENHQVISSLPATKETVGKMRALAVEEIASQIVALVSNQMTEYVESLEPDTVAEDKIAEDLEDTKF